jgi:predicted transcriptional regulator
MSGTGAPDGGVKKDAAELMEISQRALSHYVAKYRLDTPPKS